MVFTLCTEFVNSPYIEPTASGLPNPTPVEGEVRFIQAPDQSVVSRRTPRQATTHLSRRASVNNGVLTHSLDVDLKNLTLVRHYVQETKATYSLLKKWRILVDTNR